MHWPEGCVASPCRTCAPSPTPMPPTTRTPSTWRTRCPATDHPSVSRQRDSEMSQEGWLPPGLSPGLQTVNAQCCPLGLPLLHTGYRAGGLQDSDTGDECWSDTEAVPQPPPRPRDKPLSRSQSLRTIKRKPLAREVSGKKTRGRWAALALQPGPHGAPALSPTGHLALPEGADKEKDCALRHGQLGSAEPAQFYLELYRALGAV